MSVLILLRMIDALFCFMVLGWLGLAGLAGLRAYLVFCLTYIEFWFGAYLLYAVEGKLSLNIPYMIP